MLYFFIFNKNMSVKTTKKYSLYGGAIFALVIAGAFVVYNRYARAAGLLRNAAVATTTANDGLIGQTNASWKFTMTNDTALVAGDVIQVDFPTISNAPPFSFSNPSVVATSSATTTLAVAVGGNNNLTAAFTLLQTLNASTTFSITMNGVNNPLGSKANLTNLTWTFRTGTTTSGIPTDTLTTIKDGPTTATRSLVRGGYSIFSSADSAITPSSYTANATNVTYTFSFVATTSIPSGGKINIHFPTEFDITNATTTALQADINGASAGAPQIATSSAIATSTSNGRNDVIFTTSNAATGGANTVTVAVGGIANPALGVYRPIFIYTTNENGGLLDGSPFPDGANDVYNGPPPVDSIHIGGTNGMTISVYKQSGASLAKLSAAEIAQVRVGVGCPDKQFFVGMRYLDSNGSTTFSYLLDCNYKVGIDGVEGSSASFFDNFLKPGMMDVPAIGGGTKNINMVFGVPDETWTGAITNGPTTGGGTAFIQAFDGQFESWNPVFTTTGYTTQGFDGSGNGYFRLKVKTGSSWKMNVMSSGATITDNAGAKFWPPVIPAVYASSTATTSLGSFAYVLADNTLTVTLKNSATDATISTNTCVGVKRTGGGMFMGSQEMYCNAADSGGGVNYQFKVPTGAISVEVMRPGVGKPEEYPLSIAGATAKTIYVSAPTSYITVTVRDSVATAQYPLGTPISGAPIFANSSSGFGQAMTNTSGVATIYVPVGTYRVEGFAPGLGQLTAQTGVAVTSGSNPSVTFTVTTSGFKTITGTVTQNSVGLGNVQIGARGTGSTNGGNGTVTNSDGTYTLRVPAGTYKVGGWSQATGGLVEQTVDVSSANATGINWSLGASGTLRIIVSGGANISPLFGGAFDSVTGRGSGTDTWVASSTTDKYADITLPAANGYKVHVGSPVTGELTPVGGDTANIIASQTTTKTYAVSGVATLVTLSGNVKDGSSNNIANANIWVSRVSGPGFYSTLTDASGNYSFKVPDGYTYKVGVRKTGYIGADSDAAVSGATTKNFTLATAGATITGKITSDGSAGLASAWVSAKKTGSDTWTGGPTDAAGNYSLAIDTGTNWTIYAEGPCYLRSAGLAAAAGDSNKNITLTVNANCTAPTPQINALTAATGGMVSNGEKMKVDIPANALGTDSSSVSISVQDADMAVSTANAAPLKNSVQSIAASNSSGQSITSLNSKATLTIQYQESDLPVGFDESKIQMAYFDSTTGQWEPIAATVNTTLNTLTAQIDHFTDYGGITPRVPDAPQSLAASAASASAINLTWSATTITDYYDVYRSATSGGTFTAIGSSTSATYSDTGRSASTAYYYKITAVNDSGASAFSSQVSAMTNAAAAAAPAGGGSPSLGSSVAIAQIGLTSSPTPSASPSPTSSPSPSVSSSPAPSDIRLAAPASGSNPGPGLPGVKEGGLIRASNDFRVYIVKDGFARWIQNPKIFAIYRHFKFSDVKVISPSDLGKYTEASLTRAAGNPKVYEINGDGTKHWLNMTAEQFAKSGRNWNMVYIVNPAEINLYKTGADVMK